MVPQVILRQVVGDPHFENSWVQSRCKHCPSKLPHSREPLYSPSHWYDDKIIKPRTALGYSHSVHSWEALWPGMLRALCQLNQSNIMTTMCLGFLEPWAHMLVTILTPPGCSETQEAQAKCRTLWGPAHMFQIAVFIINSVWWTLFTNWSLRRIGAFIRREPAEVGLV